MNNKNYGFELIKQKDKFIVGNYYLVEQDDSISGFVLIDKQQDQLYLINFFNLKLDSKNVKSYFQGNLQSEENLDFDWISTKLLLEFLDKLLEQNLEVKEINNLKEVSETNYFLIKINETNFKNVALIKEIFNQDLLELVSKLLELTKRNQLEIDEEFKDNLLKTQGYLLDIIYDN